jgi:hypothetical protein
MTDVKYKPCCGRRCLVHGCKIREAGGCYCVCRLMDSINTFNTVIEGRSLHKASVYIPDDAIRQKAWDSLSDEQKTEEIHYRDVIAPQALIYLTKRLKTILLSNK